VARGTKLGALEFQYGLLPDLGGTAWLPRLVGAAKAKELVFTVARIDADEALRIGLVNRVVEDAELEDQVTALARMIATQPPLAFEGAKRAIDACENVQRSLELAAVGQAECLRSEDFVEAGRGLSREASAGLQGALSPAPGKGGRDLTARPGPSRGSVVASPRSPRGARPRRAASFPYRFR
jgi:enoyl-CoA hydratase/carnithine racemase